MKEYTLITTVQFTDIIQSEDYIPPTKEQVEKIFGLTVDCDDIKVIKQQIFVRDLPND